MSGGGCAGAGSLPAVPEPAQPPLAKLYVNSTSTILSVSQNNKSRKSTELFRGIPASLPLNGFYALYENSLP